MVGSWRPNRWLVERASTAGFCKRAEVAMSTSNGNSKSNTSTKGKSKPSTLYVSLDNADTVIEGGPAFDLAGPTKTKGAPSLRFVKGGNSDCLGKRTRHVLTTQNVMIQG